MRIGLDCDGVLADFAAGWVDQYNDWYGARVELDQSTWMSFLDATHFAEEADFWAWVDRVPDFWVNMPTIPGAMGGVLALQEAGHELCIVTHRHEKASRQTQIWLNRHWPIGNGLPLVHHTKRKTDIDCQLYVDDGPKPLAHFDKVGRKAIRFAYPYNKTSPAIASVKNWAELVPLVAELAEAVA